MQGEIKLFVALAIFLLSYNIASSQQLNLRIETGYCVGFSSHKYKLFENNFGLTKPIPNSEYYFKKKMTSPTSIIPDLGLKLEVIFKDKLSLETGYIFNETSSIGFNVLYNNRLGYDENHYMIMSKEGSSTEYYNSLHKVPLLISYGIDRISNENIRFDVMLGANFIWSTLKRSINDGANQTIKSTNSEFLYPDSSFIELVSFYGYDKPFSLSLLAGFGFHIRTKRREFISVRLAYEQGFNVWTAMHYELWRNQKFYTETLYSRGSNLQLKLSFPLRLYKFNK